MLRLLSFRDARDSDQGWSDTKPGVTWRVRCHCEERERRSNPGFRLERHGIASLALAMKAERVQCMSAMRELPVVPTCRTLHALSCRANQDDLWCVPCPTERGASRSSRNVGRGMRWTWCREALLRKTTCDATDVKSCGPGAPVLALSATWGQKSRSPRRAGISVKTIAQGRPGCLGQTCGTCRLHFLSQAGHGGGKLPAFPVPSSKKRVTSCKARAQIAPRE